MPLIAELQDHLPEADNEYAVFSIGFGRSDGRRAHQNFISQDMHDGPMNTRYDVWVVANRTRTILVDTGFNSRVAERRKTPFYTDPVTCLERIGLAPAEIEDVVITHLHYDHAGNIDRFDNARFHVQDAEVSFATGRCMCNHLLRAPFEVEDVVTLIRKNYSGRVCFHDGNDELYPGVGLHVYPGHSSALQAVSVDTPRGRIVLASDVAHFYANILRRNPFPISLNFPDIYQSFDGMMKLSGGIQNIVPGHDPWIKKLYPAIEVKGIEVILLHKPPHAEALQGLLACDGL